MTPYDLTRIIIGILLWLALFVICKKRENKQAFKIGTLIIIGITVVLDLIPFENALPIFSSPEAVYEYTKGAESTGYIDGRELVCVYGEKGLDLYKKQNGYLRFNNTLLREFKKTLTESYFVKAYGEEDDCFLYVIIFDGGFVADNRDTVFQVIGQDDYSGMEWMLAYIGELDTQYKLSINNETVIFE